MGADPRAAVEVLAGLAEFVPPEEDRETLAALLEGHLDSFRALELEVGENDPITNFDPRWYA